MSIMREKEVELLCSIVCFLNENVLLSTIFIVVD